MSGLDPMALSASTIAAAAALIALAARGAAATIVAVGVAMVATAVAAALFGAPAASGFAIAAAAMITICIVGAELVAPDPAPERRPVIAAAAALLVLAGGLVFAMSDAPGPIAKTKALLSPDGALVAAAILSSCAAAAFAMLNDDGRSALLDAPSPVARRFPGREHAVSRGIGKGLAPLLAIAALALAGPTAAPLAAGGLAALALTLYALVFGLDAALRAAPARLLLLAMWGGLGAAAIGVLASSTKEAATIAAPAAAVAAAAGVFGAMSLIFYGVSGRLPALPIAEDAPDAEGESRG